jgi:hypothetical protein
MHGHSTEIRLCIAPACEGWKHIGESKRPRPTCYLCDGEAEADGGVCERHDGGEDGEPPELVEVGELREQGLDAREDGHVHRGVGPARRVVAVAVEAVGPVDRPATNFIQTICPSSIYHACEKGFFSSLLVKLKEEIDSYSPGMPTQATPFPAGGHLLPFSFSGKRRRNNKAAS